MSPDFVSEALTEHHELSQFDAGKPTLNHWLTGFARHSDAKRQSRTYVWHPGDLAVVAYFALCPHIIQRGELPRRLGRSDPAQVPALLLARLALDIRFQGRGLGSQLLLDALSRAVSVSNKVGGRYVVVDAIDDQAAGFYEHHGFKACPPATVRRYVRKTSDIAVSLDRE